MVTIKKDIAETKKPNIALNWSTKIFKQTIVLIILMAIWEIAPRAGLVDRTFFPPFSPFRGSAGSFENQQ